MSLLVSLIEKKEEDKYINSNQLKHETSIMRKIENIDSMPLLMEALVTVTNSLEEWIEILELELTEEML